MNNRIEIEPVESIKIEPSFLVQIQKDAFKINTCSHFKKMLVKKSISTDIYVPKELELVFDYLIEKVLLGDLDRIVESSYLEGFEDGRKL